MKRLILLSLFVAPIALAQLGLRQGTGAAKQIRDLSCVSDGGLYCSRDAGSAIGGIRCVGATATETGCITPGSQTIAGDKTLTGYLRMTGVAHGSLTACSGGVKNMMQGCTTHGALVWCDGTNNIEVTGTSAREQELASIDVHGIPGIGALDAFVLPSSSGWTINALVGGWQAGTGSGTLRLYFSGAAGTCTCDIDCDNPSVRNACSGNCTYAAGDSVSFARVANSSTGVTACTFDPSNRGGVHVMGVPYP